jgi:hypothetical protein
MFLNYDCRFSSVSFYRDLTVMLNFLVLVWRFLEVCIGSFFNMVLEYAKSGKNIIYQFLAYIYANYDPNIKKYC